MSIHYVSLLLAVTFSGASILIAILASWMSTNKEKYLICGAVGLGLVTLAVGMMSLRNGVFNFVTLTLPFTTLLAGLSFIYASVRRFLHKTDQRPPIAIGATGTVLMTIAFATGYLGLGNIILNVFGGAILILSGIEYLRTRDDMPAAYLAASGLYILTGLSFLLCVVNVVIDGHIVTYPAIDTWSDNLNGIVSLVGVSGIGALTLTMHFARTARKHHTESLTDPLTGVLNRRALFARYPENGVIPATPVLLFDLDHFKTINDHLGHAHGDTTLQWFADIMRSHATERDSVARIGGEEFCMILPGRSRAEANDTAEHIRASFADLEIPCGRDGSVATVSVGLATGGQLEPFVSVLSRADAALYKAKSMGRNMVREGEVVRAA